VHSLAKRPRAHKLIERHATVRSALRQVLREGPLTARELSARVGIGEKEVSGHLEHLARSRLTKPSKCPACRSQRMDPPRFVILTGGPHDRR
jgi:predicted Zn-ribbon and HTH transcriptional regulator